MDIKETEKIVAAGGKRGCHSTGIVTRWTGNWLMGKSLSTGCAFEALVR
jgi:hypothetical protein